MQVFELRDTVIRDYGNYVRSFLNIRDERIAALVETELNGGFLWPEPLVQLNPAFEPGEPLDDLVARGALHAECLKIFRRKDTPDSDGGLLRLHRHQVESIEAARAGDNYVLTTGTGSGKSLSYIVPIVDHVLRNGSGRGIQAIIVYPMNALANSQLGELEKFLCYGYPDGRPPVSFRRYTGQEKDEQRREIIANPPDILLTNYVMLELVLTRVHERKLIEAARGLRFLALDELHTYRGRQGADVAMLVRRVRDACGVQNLIHVGTSATLASEGTWPEQQEAVAAVASTLFGTQVKPERIIGETLRRVTPADDIAAPEFVESLTRRLAGGGAPDPLDATAFLSDPLAVWLESTFGLREEPGTGRLVRCTPRPVGGASGAAADLERFTGVPLERCEDAVREALLAGYQCHDDLGRSVFAFRLHQFLSKGESVYASPEVEDVRHITLQAQQFVPNDRQRVLLPVAFCRECGQEYYVVRRGKDGGGRFLYLQRELSDRADNDDGEAGFLHVDTKRPWPSRPDEIIARLPDSWLEERDGKTVIRKARRARLPREVFVSTGGVEGGGTLRAHYFEAPFLFCLNCGVAYDAHQTSDFGKLATLGSEGRSTATTILSLSAIRELRRDEDLVRRARKLLSFTDNRQDASLQAGHFNDFIEIAVLRAGLWRAVDDAGEDGLLHDNLTRRVFDALSLPLSHYAVNPAVEYVQLEETQRALRQVLGYYLYRDLRRGWRVTSPNLEQCGLLDIDYRSLGRFCADEPKWLSRHTALASASPDQRQHACRVLLDFMRRELAIRVGFLDPDEQESIRLLSGQYLIAPWALDDGERLERSRIVFPRSRGEERADSERLVYVSPRGGFGLFLKRPTTFPGSAGSLTLDDVEEIIRDLLDALCVPGLVHRVMEPRFEGDVPGYQLNASGLVWRAGAGVQAFHDPVRVPNAPAEGLRTNPFFVGFYRERNDDLKDVRAHEHTAQVPPAVREAREEEFREARLPVLFCSPTMELGVDIAQLNVVNLRNVPPTPANYAQRSGRAGRSGQPAFVYTYCAAGSPHDQYFFKRPQRMVAGAVTPPRLDLANEDLLRAHVHAIWLSEARLSLGSSLADVLDVATDNPTLTLLSKVSRALDDRGARERAAQHARATVGPAIAEVVAGDGSAGVDAWIAEVLGRLPQSFDAACERWRGLYRAALIQSERQSRIVRDASRDTKDRDRARLLRNEAEAQLRLLLETGEEQRSDFYSYRYFASEGFLPGYNFPRLPLSAFLPGRRRRQGGDEFLSRPRFLAISEFGPRAIIYHEGSRYVINKVILPVDPDRTSIVRRAAQCRTCGYLHPLGDEPAPDLCHRCGERLPAPFENLFRMQNVATRRRDRINSDEEERLRLGYEIRTGVRFAERQGSVSARTATLEGPNGELLATLVYAHSATIWRINMGWRRRTDRDRTGYVMDVERGFWARNQAVDDDPDDPMSPRTERVIPYVEDSRNCVLVEPADSAELGDGGMASLQAALKKAIQAEFQLEDAELAAEPLPDVAGRRMILLYEASEGGAGVLRRLVEDPAALPRVARAALDICHFDPSDARDLRRAPNAREDCEAACYDCLLSYYNQREHRLLDRQQLPQLLLRWAAGVLRHAPGVLAREPHIERLMRLTESELERRWLRRVAELGLRLPTEAQRLFEASAVRADFFYGDNDLAVFVDGPHHDEPRQRAADASADERLLDEGTFCLRFHHAADWDDIFRRHPSVFGRFPEHPSAPAGVPLTDDPSRDGIVLDLFEDEWHPLVELIASRESLDIDAGGDVSLDGRVVGRGVALVTRGDRAVHVVDDADPDAAAVVDALKAQGHPSVRVRSNAIEASMEAIEAALEA